MLFLICVYVFVSVVHVYRENIQLCCQPFGLGLPHLFLICLCAPVP